MSSSSGKKELFQIAVERLNSVFDLYELTHGKGRYYRAMRRERREAVIAILKAILYIHLNDPQKEAATVKEIACKSGLTLKRAQRAIYDLFCARLMEVCPSHLLPEAASLCQLTWYFWDSLGLWQTYAEAMGLAGGSFLPGGRALRASAGASRRPVSSGAEYSAP